MTHSDLVKCGVRWLKRNGCRIILSDPFKAAVSTGECPDVIGWRDGLSLLLECKASRADFLVDARKPFRVQPGMGMGDWRFYLTQPGTISADELPSGWGLLIAHAKRVEVVRGGPHGNCGWWSEKPFDGHKRNETIMLVSAMARQATKTCKSCGNVTAANTKKPPTQNELRAAALVIGRCSC